MSILLEEKYKVIQEDAMKYINKYIQDIDIKKDIYQEAVFTLLNKNINIENESALRTWLFYTIKNYIIEYYKSKKKENKLNDAIFQELYSNQRNAINYNFNDIKIQDNIKELTEKINDINYMEYGIIYLWKVEKLTLKTISSIYEISVRTTYRIIQKVIGRLVQRKMKRFKEK